MGMPQSNAEPSAAPSTPAPYEKIYDDSGKLVTSASTPNRAGAGPTATPSPDPNTGFPAASVGNEPTTAPYDPRFETPNNPNWGPPPISDGMAPFDPQQYLPSNAGANIPTPGESQIPHETGQFMPYESMNVPTGEGGYSEPQFYPSEGANIPTDQDYVYPNDPQQYSSPAENVPTSESMAPAGTNEFLPSAGANVPTNEYMSPTDPQQYYDSSAGANIPTNESMLPTGPEEYLPSTTGEMSAYDPGADYGPAQDTSYYPAGDGSYVQLDGNGDPVDVLPAQPVFDVADNGGQGPLYPSGDNTGATGNFTADLGADIGDIGNFFSALGNTPSPHTGPYHSQGGVPAPGSMGGTFGQGSAGILPWDYFGRRSISKLRSGGDATLGFGRPGDAISQFAAAAGRGGGRGNRSFTGPMLPYSQWGGVGAGSGTDQRQRSTQKPGGGAGITSGGGPGGIA